MSFGRIYKNGIIDDFSSDPEFVMMIGLPASGKSTLSKKMAESGEYVWYSSDNIREELFGDAAEQKNNSIVFDVMAERTKNSLKEGKSVVYDATNLSVRRRTSFLKSTLGGIRCRKIAYLILTDFKECRRRNYERERKVPDDVMDGMMKTFYFPWWSEGWDEICFVKDDATYLLRDLIMPLVNMEHENPYHKGTIGQHLFDVGRNSKMNTPFLKNLGLLHDVGKSFCKVFVDKRGNPTEDAHYYGHANVGAYMSMFVRDNLSWERKLKRAILIQYHMEKYLRDEKGMKILEKALGPTMWEMLERLMEADAAAAH